MSTLIPNRYLFDFEFPLRYRSRPPVMDGDLSDWSDRELLPRLGALDGQKDFARVWSCWNESGLYFACQVEGKRSSLRCDPRSYWAADNVRLCTDMRDARNNRRATRFCQQFYLLPTGGGPKHDQPTGASVSIRQARESAPLMSPDRLKAAARVTRGGYALEAHLPADCLQGFDPVDHPRIGLYYIVEDDDLGQQYLTVGDELLWYVDPSTWATAVLTR